MAARGAVPLLIAAAATRTARAATRLPLPTIPQLRYQRDELVAIVQFSSGAYLDCTKGFDPKKFQPAALDMSSWADLVIDMGARSAWIPVKGFCGFLLWPTKTTLPDGRPYGFSVADAGHPDLLRQFLTTFNARGLGAGAYYDLDFNWYLSEWRFHVVQANQTRLPGQQNVTQSDLEEIMFAQLRELWGGYGDLYEMWFDGGFLDYWEPRLRELLQLQPEAVVFNGCAANGRAADGSCVAPNPACWVGTESGFAPDPTWSTGTAGSGNASSGRWCPKTVDTTLQVPDPWNGDGWNYNASSAVKPLSALIDTYHNSVGHGGVLELNVDMDLSGNPAPDRAARLREFGAWIRGCYAAAVAEARGSWTIRLDTRVATDRVWLREDLTYGQRVRRYEVVSGGRDGRAVVLSNGTAVGSKKIDLFDPGHHGTVTVRVTDAAATPHLTFAAFAPCAAA